MNKLNFTKGVSLIELMVAVTISSVLLLGVGTVYTSSKRGYVVQEEFSTLQENARVAMKFLVSDIRMAGFVGCAWNNDLNYENFLQSTGNASDDAFLGQFNIGVEGFEATNSGPGAATIDLAGPAAGWDRPLPNVITLETPSPGSDVLLVRRARGSGIKLTENKNSANFKISNQGVPFGAGPCHAPTGICQTDILMVSDCTKSRLFQGSQIQDNPGELRIVHQAAGTPGNAPPVSWGGNSDANHHFEAGDAEIFKASAFAYYVDTGASGEPALFRLDASPGSQREELVEGVESMQVLFGIDTDKANATDITFDGIANQYLPADLVNFANDNIVSARISLLVRSRQIKETAIIPPNPYKLGGTTAASSTRVTTSVADRRLRKVFTITIKIRNKGLT